ncbi:TonB-dependent receptor [Thalassotalea sp. LPB0316]|uniref:TonB-dependent receptor n=1 Tax=Thalassotalea sp. LPB0316 TaxID=2769490 RepID=UPI0018665EE6|nr:TonB-dependent receptor [Thalassotalea sp. LPB0316]QOL25878.1 TonB-dependent receptor [Thalassotalea sp. LPB0316]
MNKLNNVAKGIKLALMLGAACSVNAYAQDAQEQAIAVQAAANEVQTDPLLEEETEERIVVTGSRIRRSEFDTASPVQVISGEISRELGLFDATQMLQRTNQAAGAQIDNTFGGYVLDNGPGSASIGFRGLGADRTLVMINGRRMAPAGVGGAPTTPDLNLIPAVMIERIENLYDGASTVYGSDAIAGVANVMLRQDFEGFEIQGSANQPKGDGGEETVLSAMWGKTSDNGYIAIGAEYYDRKAQSLADNPFVRGCEERIFETENGDIVKRYGGIGPTVNGEDSCDIFPLTNRMFIENGFWGSVYNTPGFTNTGIPNWSESTVPFQYAGLLPTWITGDSNGDGIHDVAFPDGNGDGLRDFDFQDPRYAFQQSDYYKSGDYLGKNERISVVANGEYNFQDENDTTIYFDALYAQRNSDQFSPGAQLFQMVEADNPFNPCNPNGINGIDCFGVLGFGNAGPLRAMPIINIHGDRDTHKVDVSQYRLVGGVTGNLTGLESVGLDNWYYDVYASFSASSGEYITRGINEANLIHSLNTSVLNADGSVTCGDGSDGCVPVNLFADNIYQTGGGTLTAAEYDYLMSDRIADTEIEQFVTVGFVGGELGKLPWNGNPVNAIFGAEYRKEEIKTNNNDVATDGLLWGWFSDKGANGDRSFKEFFTEIELPLVSGRPGVEEFTFTMSGRWTDESYYDAATTYSLKGVYRPVEWFTLRGTKGTSYRAPNLRERFLAGTTGFNSVTDPCVVPSDARISDALDPTAPDAYDPTRDTRDPTVLQACNADGVDPTLLGLGQNGTEKFTPTNSTEIVSGGSTQLSEETSVAKTYGFIFEQPFSEEFDLTFSVTKFDIEITNSIAEPTAAYSVSQCYSADGNDAFCSRLSRNSDGQINFVDASFINIGLETSKGMDYNLYYAQDFLVGEQNLNVSLDLQATKMDEAVVDIFGSVDDNVGEPDFPEWRATAQLSFEYDDWRFNWFTQFIGKGKEDYYNDEDGGFNAFEVGCDGFYSDAAQTVPLDCRPVGATEDYFLHNMSVSYSTDDFRVAVGVRNVFNEAPPLVDPSGSFSNTNIPLGVGYDTFGRTPFINFSAVF